MRVIVRSDGSGAVRRVADTGVGIPGDLLARVFELFTQVGGDVGRSESGLGIGLAVVRRLVEQHGGHVEAHSDGANRGSTFVVWLPRVDPVAQDDRAAERAVDGSPRDQRRVLLVEDSDDVREATRLLLETAGHLVFVAKTGCAANEEGVAFGPNVALVDIGLPDMDGYEVARRLRTKLGDKVRLIAPTGYGQPEDRRRSLEAGFDAHVVKPLEPEELARIVTG